MTRQSVLHRGGGAVARGGRSPGGTAGRLPAGDANRNVAGAGQRSSRPVVAHRSAAGAREAGAPDRRGNRQTFGEALLGRVMASVTAIEDVDVFSRRVGWDQAKFVKIVL